MSSQALTDGQNVIVIVMFYQQIPTSHIRQQQCVHMCEFGYANLLVCLANHCHHDHQEYDDDNDDCDHDRNDIIGGLLGKKHKKEMI